jgi:hypothetical protein
MASIVRAMEIMEAVRESPGKSAPLLLFYTLEPPYALVFHALVGTLRSCGQIAESCASGHGASWKS